MKCLLFVKKTYPGLRNIAKKRAAWVSKHRGANSTCPPKVYTYWAQGMNLAPAIVKACLRSADSIYGKNLIVLDDTNWFHFVDIDSAILDKVYSNKTAFSDLLRLELLSKYGGIWQDATCYCTGNVLREFDSIVISNFFAFLKDFPGGVSSWYWAAKPGCFTISLLREMMLAYWKEYEKLAHYFVMHQILKELYKLDATVKSEMQGIPIFNWNPRKMKSVLLKSASSQSYTALSHASPVHKLTYKYPQGKVTSKHFYSYLIQLDLGLDGGGGV